MRVCISSIGIFVFVLGFIIASTHAQDSTATLNSTPSQDSDTASTLSSTVVPKDTVPLVNTRKSASEDPEDLLEQKEDLDDEIENLKDNLDDIKENIQDLHEDKLEAIAEKKRERRSSFTFTAGISNLDIDPVVMLKNSDFNLKKKQFNFNRDNIFMIGFMGLYNQGHGVRFGVDLTGGYKTFKSDIYKGIVKIDTITKDTTWKDSLTVLRVIPVCFGFIGEKAFVFGKFSIFGGFMLGGGTTIVLKNNEPANTNSPFISENDSIARTSNWGIAHAPSLTWDLHGGISFALAPSFHVGIDGLCLFTYAVNGFGPGTDSFVTANPGIRLRLTAGK